MKISSNRHRFSWAEKSGIAALLLALFLGYFDYSYAVIPLLLFLLACLFAPFCPRWAFFLPLISRGMPGSDGVAITIDDGPSPETTPVLLELLAKHSLPATFFVVGENAAAHPELVKMIVDHGHAVGNHSFRHDNLLMLRSSRRLREDIAHTQQVLAGLGIRPLLFRPPVGITNPRLGPVLAGLALEAITFSNRGADFGNRNIDHLSARVLWRLQPGAILLLHDIPPLDLEKTASWRKEVDQLFAILKKEHQVMPLAELIGRPVMKMGQAEDN
jgi:peptidoglycan/xylan/chitin deacetylase (PgdA/CDA1 family)